jgi:hypothetical protein
MASEAASAPFAVAAGEIDFAGDALPTLDDLTDEFVARCSREAVVSTLQFEVRGADTGG